MKTFQEWLEEGLQFGWVVRPSCSTHDGIPTTAAEEEEFEEGDPCIHVLRLCWDEAERDAVLANSRWVSP